MTGDYRLCALILWPMIGALIGYQIGHKDKIARDYFADVVVITEFILLMGMFRIVFAGVTPEFRFSGYVWPELPSAAGWLPGSILYDRGFYLGDDNAHFPGIF